MDYLRVEEPVADYGEGDPEGPLTDVDAAAEDLNMCAFALTHALSWTPEYAMPGMADDLLRARGSA